MLAAVGCDDGWLWSGNEGDKMAKSMMGIYALMVTALWIAAAYKLLPVVMTIVYNFKRFMG